MSDIPNSLVEQLAGQGVSEVILPSRVGGVGHGANTATERHAADPAVQEAAKAYFEDPLRLAGDKMSDEVLIREKAIHRMMIYLSACGRTVAEIAEQTGYQPGAIYRVLRQPWAKQRLVALLDEMGRDRVKHFLANEVSPSLETLQVIRDDPKVQAAARITAANSILDRALGKPTIHVESNNTNTNVPADAAKLDRELAEVRKQLASKGVGDERN